VVCKPAVAARNRTGRTRWGHGKILGDAHVHHVGIAKDRHESRRAPTGVGLVARKSEWFYETRLIEMEPPESPYVRYYRYLGIPRIHMSALKIKMFSSAILDSEGSEERIGFTHDVCFCFFIRLKP